MSNQQQEQAVSAERAWTVLHSSSSSVESELAHAQGWLHLAKSSDRTDFWAVDMAAGAVGSLVNAWGRLTLWSRVNGRHDQVQNDLDWAADHLVEAFRHLLTAPADHTETTLLTEIADRLNRVYQVVK